MWVAPGTEAFLSLCRRTLHGGGRKQPLLKPQSGPTKWLNVQPNAVSSSSSSPSSSASGTSSLPHPQHSLGLSYASPPSPGGGSTERGGDRHALGGASPLDPPLNGRIPVNSPGAMRMVHRAVTHHSPNSTNGSFISPFTLTRTTTTTNHEDATHALARWGKLQSEASALAKAKQKPPKARAARYVLLLMMLDEPTVYCALPGGHCVLCSVNIKLLLTVYL
jgi:hypothetical protein